MSNIPPMHGSPLPRFLGAIVFTFAAFALLVPVSPATAEQGVVVITSGSRYLPGDDDLAPMSLVVPTGVSLDYTNLDISAAHSVTSDRTDVFGVPLFDSDVISFRASTAVNGVEDLPVGTYGFHCSIHQGGMHGTITVVGT